MIKNPLREELAQVLRHELIRNRVKQNILADHLSVTPSAISQLLQGKIVPSMTQLNRICELLGLSRHRVFELRCLLSKIRCGSDCIQSPLGELVARYRREKGITRQELSQLSTLPDHVLELMETTPHLVPDVTDLQKLAIVFGCPVEEFFTAAGLDWRVNALTTEPIRGMGGLCLREPQAAYTPTVMPTIFTPDSINSSRLGVIPSSMKYKDFWKKLNAFEGDIFGNKVAEAAGVPVDRPIELIASGLELDLAGKSAWKLIIKSLSTLCAGELALVRFRKSKKIALLVLDNSRTNLVGRKLFRKSNKAMQLSEDTFSAIIPIECIEFIPHGIV